jgi:hypothetical protein
VRLTVRATAVAALAFSSSSVRASFIQFPIPADADVVAESAAAAPSGIDGGGRAFMSASQAAARAAVGQVGNGLPDNGQFIEVSTGGVIQLLPYSGNNVVRRSSANGAPFTVNTTPSAYSALTIFATAGDASGTINVALNYTNGTVNIGPVPVPDWFNDPPPAGVGYLVDGLDRTLTAGAGFEDSNDPAIFAIPLTPDPTRTLSSLTITRTSTTDVLNVFGVIGNSVPEPAAAGTLAMLGTGLLARRWRRA